MTRPSRFGAIHGTRAVLEQFFEIQAIFDTTRAMFGCDSALAWASGR
jgi:hypothetical protein